MLNFVGQRKACSSLNITENSEKVQKSLTKRSEAPRPQAGASRKGNIVLIVPLDPAYKAGLAGHLPVKNKDSTAEHSFFP
jgi:hypothetical protein